MLQQFPHITPLNTHSTPVCEGTSRICHAPSPDLGGRLLLLLLVRAEHAAGTTLLHPPQGPSSEVQAELLCSLGVTGGEQRGDVWACVLSS